MKNKMVLDLEKKLNHLKNHPIYQMYFNQLQQSDTFVNSDIVGFDKDLIKELQRKLEIRLLTMQARRQLKVKLSYVELTNDSGTVVDYTQTIPILNIKEQERLTYKPEPRNDKDVPIYDLLVVAVKATSLNEQIGQIKLSIERNIQVKYQPKYLHVSEYQPKIAAENYILLSEYVIPGESEKSSIAIIMYCLLCKRRGFSYGKAGHLPHSDHDLCGIRVTSQLQQLNMSFVCVKESNKSTIWSKCVLDNLHLRSTNRISNKKLFESKKKHHNLHFVFGEFHSTPSKDNSENKDNDDKTIRNKSSIAPKSLSDNYFMSSLAQLSDQEHSFDDSSIDKTDKLSEVNNDLFKEIRENKSRYSKLKEPIADVFFKRSRAVSLSDTVSSHKKDTENEDAKLIQDHILNKASITNDSRPSMDTSSSSTTESSSNSAGNSDSKPYMQIHIQDATNEIGAVPVSKAVHSERSNEQSMSTTTLSERSVPLANQQVNRNQNNQISAHFNEPIMTEPSSDESRVKLDTISHSTTPQTKITSKSVSPKSSCMLENINNPVSPHRLKKKSTTFFEMRPKYPTKQTGLNTPTPEKTSKVTNIEQEKIWDDESLNKLPATKGFFEVPFEKTSGKRAPPKEFLDLVRVYVRYKPATTIKDMSNPTRFSLYKMKNEYTAKKCGNIMNMSCLILAHEPLNWSFFREAENILKELIMVRDMFLPRVTVDHQFIPFDKVASFMEKTTGYVTLRNFSMLPVEWMFIPDTTSLTVAPPGMKMNPKAGIIAPHGVQLICLDQTICIRILRNPKKLRQKLNIQIIGGGQLSVVPQVRYLQSCFGLPLKELVHMTEPVGRLARRKHYSKDFYDINAANDHHLDTSILYPVEANYSTYALHHLAQMQVQNTLSFFIPKELQVLVECAKKLCIRKPGLFKHGGYRRDLKEIRWLLDNMDTATIPTKMQYVSAFSILESIVLFYDLLPEPIFGTHLYGRILDASKNYRTSLEIYSLLPQLEKNAFIYLICFLKELVFYSKENNVTDYEAIADYFSEVLIKPPKSDEYGVNEKHKEKKRQFLLYFLIGDIREIFELNLRLTVREMQHTIKLQAKEL